MSQLYKPSKKNNNQQQPISIRGNTFNYINLGGGAAHVTLGHCYFWWVDSRSSLMDSPAFFITKIHH